MNTETQVDPQIMAAWFAENKDAIIGGAPSADDIVHRIDTGEWPKPDENNICRCKSCDRLREAWNYFPKA